MYKSPPSPSERIKHKKIINLIEREFLAQEGHDDDPITFVKITNLASRDPDEAKRKLTQIILNQYFDNLYFCVILHELFLLRR